MSIKIRLVSFLDENFKSVENCPQGQRPLQKRAPFWKIFPGTKFRPLPNLYLDINVVMLTPTYSQVTK